MAGRDAAPGGEQAVDPLGHEREVVLPPEEHAPANWCEDIVGALTKGTPVACDGLQGRRSVLVNQAIYECPRSGKPVRVDG